MTGKGKTRAPRGALSGAACCVAFTLIALYAVLCAPAARAQGSRKDDIAFNAQGRPMAGATVRVCTSAGSGQPCAPLANIYSDNALTMPLANPITADGLGNYTFYAAPGRYEIEITGPGIITKQMINVILPTDPSSPDNFYAGNQHFAGPDPWIDVTAMTPPACAFSPNLEIGVTGSIASGSNLLTLNQPLSVANGCGIMVHGAGATSSMAAPTGGTVVAHNGTGSTTYHYKAVAIDGNFHGTSPASAAATTTNGLATLSKYQYNYVTWTVPNSPAPIAVIVYGDKGLGGAYTCLGVTRAISNASGSWLAAWEDMGFYGANKPPCPTWAPATPPSAAGAQTLISTIASGAGTTTLTLADAAVNPVSGGLVHSDNTLAFIAAENAQIAHSGSNIGPRIFIPQYSFALAYMPNAASVDNGGWNFESYGALYMSDGLGFDIPAASLWFGRGTNASEQFGSGYAAYIGGTYDGPGNTSVLDDVVVMFNNNASVDGIVTAAPFNGLETVTASLFSVQHIYVDGHASDGCGMRFIGNSIGPINVEHSTLSMDEDQTGLGAVCIDEPLEVLGGMSGVNFNDLNWAGNAVYMTCPFGCSNFSLLQQSTWTGGLGENEGTPAFILLDPGTATEGSSGGINNFIVTNNIVDPDAYDGPLITVMDVPNKRNVGAQQVVLNASGTSLAGSISVAGATNDSGSIALYNLLLGSSCPDGGGFNQAAWAQSFSWGPVRHRYAGSCVGGAGAGIQSNVGVYQAGDYGRPIHNYNFATLIPPPDPATPTLTTGSLTGTYYYRFTSVDEAGRESQVGSEVVATPSSQGVVLGYSIGGGVLYGAAGVNVYRGTTPGNENLLLCASSPCTTSLSSFTDTGSLTTSSATPPLQSDAFESVLAERGGDFSYLFAAQPANLYQKRMGFGTAADPGGSSNIKWAFNGRTQFQSGVMVPLATKTSAYTLTINDYWVNVTGTTTITVPHANAGELWIVFNSGAGTVTLQADSGTINGAASITLAANTGYTVACDGSNCFGAH